MSGLLAAITQFIAQTISDFGYFGVAALMAIESAAIPLPSEVIMPLSGFLVESGRFSLFGLAIAGGVGSLVGSVLTYLLGYYGGRPLIHRYGRYIFISEHDLALSEKFFHRFGSVSTLIGRVIPVVRTFVSIPAGIGKVKFLPFVVYSFVGSVLWSYLLAWLGFRLGENWDLLEGYFRKFDFVILAIIIAGVVFWIRRHIKNRVK